MRVSIVSVVVFCLVALALPSSSFAQGQPGAVNLTVEAGYDGYYRLAQWFPVTVMVSNDGPDVQGVLEWRFPGQGDDTTFQREVDLPHGARKQVTLYAYSLSFARLGEVRLLRGRTLIHTQQVRLEPIDVDQVVIGVLSSDTTLLNSLTSLTFNNVPQVVVLHLDSVAIPTHARALDGLDVLFVHDSDTARLSQDQHNALRLWVQLGGQLIVSGGASASLSTAGLADLLPVTVGGLERDVSLASLRQLVRSTTPGTQESLPESTTVSHVDLLPDAQALDSARLVTAHHVGVGRVIFCAFDLSVLRGWVGESTLWNRVLQAEPRFAPGAMPRWSGASDLLHDTLALPELERPSFGLMFLFILTYIVIIGPINFLVLRWLRRPDLAWVTIPALVLVFVLGTYGASFVIRGYKPEVMQLGIVQGFEGEPQGEGAAYIGIFSPRRTTYTLQFPTDALIRSAVSSGSALNTTQVVWSDDAATIQDALIDVSSLRTFVSEQHVDVPIQIQSDIRHEQGMLQGMIENRGTTPLTDVLLVQGDRVYQLGMLAPGEQKQIQVATENMLMFPDLASASVEGIFNRQSLLYSLFGYNRINYSILTLSDSHQGMFDTESIYMLAWSNQPLIDVQINGEQMEQQAHTLYVIRLNDARMAD